MKKYAVLSVVVLSLLMLLSSEVMGRGIFRRGIFRGRCGGGVVSCAAPVSCAIPVHHEVVAVQEIAVAYPILVPAYQFQYAPPSITVPTVQLYNQGYVQQGYVQQGYVQQGYGQQQLYNQGYGQQYVQPQQPQVQLNNLSNDKIKELARALMEEMNKIAEGGENQPAVPQSSLPTQPQFNAPQNPALNVPQNNANALQYQALTVMVKNCAACHTGVGSKKGMVIFSQPGYFNSNANLKKIFDMVASGAMPPQDSQFHINSQEKDTIIAWLQSKGVN